MMGLFLVSVVVVLFAGAVCSSSSSSSGLPNKSLGVYLLVADDTIPGYTSNDNWQPELPGYLNSGSNAVFFSFINPTQMKIPTSFINFAKTRGTGNNGSIPGNTLIIFSVGGYSYSLHPNPWPWLASPSAAVAMAQEVATWSSKYGCDGIDIDIETGAGDAPDVGPNLITFIKTLKSINPSMIVTQPVFGYPQVGAEIYVVNHSWDKNGTSLGLADTVGIMVYQGSQSLMYVKNYAQGAQQWQGFPITVDVTPEAVWCGTGGQASEGDLGTLASAIKQQRLGGIMVWYASVIDPRTGKIAFQYAGGSGDATPAASSMWATALQQMQ